MKTRTMFENEEQMRARKVKWIKANESLKGSWRVYAADACGMKEIWWFFGRQLPYRVGACGGKCFRTLKEAKEYAELLCIK